MRTLITEYRGWEIFFDTDKEEFYTVSNEYDKDNIKKSFAATKKFIDDYIKSNFNFKPILVQNESSIYRDMEIRKITGIRKDGDFIFEDKEGNPKRFSKYDARDYFLVNQDNDYLFENIRALELQSKGIGSQIKELKEKLIKVDVRQIKEKLLNEKINDK